MKRKIKAILFDVGGVLVLPKNKIYLRKHSNKNRGVHLEISEKLGINLDQWLDSIDTAYALSIEGKITRKQVMNILSKNTKTNKQKLKKIIIDAYQNNFTQNIQLYNEIFKLREQGFKIGILSDQWYLSKTALILKKYTRLFNDVVISCDVGMRKPNPEIYKLSLKNLGVTAQNTLFIDNQEWNLRPAKKLGMKTILFKDNKQLFKQLSLLGINHGK